MFKLQGVTKIFGASRVLGPIDLEINSGTTVLMGTSGCGKSTILRLLLGLVEPTAGTICFESNILQANHLNGIRRRIGYVIQDGGLFPHLTARQNIAVMPRHLQWEKRRLDRRIAELAGLVQVDPSALDRLPHELSGGQRQRIALMRALVLDPDALLLDEPLAALDPLIRRDLQEQLRQIIRSVGKTAVLVTHDVGEAAYFGDHIILLRDGQIVQQGNWREFVETPADPFVTQFINAQRPLPVEVS